MFLKLFAQTCDYYHYYILVKQKINFTLSSLVLRIIGRRKSITWPATGRPSRIVRISWLWHYIHYLSIPLCTNSWSNPFFEEQRGYTIICILSWHIRPQKIHRKCLINKSLNARHKDSLVRRNVTFCILSCFVIFSFVYVCWKHNFCIYLVFM